MEARKKAEFIPTIGPWENEFTICICCPFRLCLLCLGAELNCCLTLSLLYCLVFLSYKLLYRHSLSFNPNCLFIYFFFAFLLILKSQSWLCISQREQLLFGNRSPTVDVGTATVVYIQWTVWSSATGIERLPLIFVFLFFFVENLCCFTCQLLFCSISHSWRSNDSLNVNCSYNSRINCNRSWSFLFWALEGLSVWKIKKRQLMDVTWDSYNSHFYLCNLV